MVRFSVGSHIGVEIRYTIEDNHNTCVCILINFVCAEMHACTQYQHTHIHAHAHARTHAHTYTHTTYARTHTHTFLLMLLPSCI